MEKTDVYSVLPGPVADLARKDTVSLARSLTLWVGIPAVIAFGLGVFVLRYALREGRVFSLESAMGGNHGPPNGIRGEEFWPIFVGFLLAAMGAALVAWAWRRRHPLLKLADPAVKVAFIYILETWRGGSVFHTLVMGLADETELRVELPRKMLSDTENARTAEQIARSFARCYPSVNAEVRRAAHGPG